MKLDDLVKEYRDGANGLMRWFESQDVAPGRACALSLYVASVLLARAANKDQARLEVGLMLHLAIFEMLVKEHFNMTKDGTL